MTVWYSPHTDQLIVVTLLTVRGMWAWRYGVSKKDIAILRTPPKQNGLIYIGEYYSGDYYEQC